MTQDLASLEAQAEEAFGSGRLQEAERLCGSILGEDPENPQANVFMGFIAAQTNRPGLAIDHLKRAAQVDRTLWGPRLALAVLLQKSGTSAESIPYLQEAIGLKPEDADSHFQLGNCYLEAGHLAEAGEAFERAIRLEPGNASYQMALGSAFERLGLIDLALSAYQKVPPNDSGLQAKIEALQLASLTVTVPFEPPATGAGAFWLAKQFSLAGREAEAESLFKRAIELDPSRAEYRSNLGAMLQQLGRFQEGNDRLQEALRLQPRWAPLYTLYVSGHQMGEDDRPLIDRMAALLDDPDLKPFDRAQLHGSLGKAFDDLGGYEAAMDQFEAAHRLTREGLRGEGHVFDRVSCADRASQIIDTFTPEFFQGRSSFGNPSDLPLLIVGMIRSGTTLVEQILSSHPRIGSAGESLFWYQDQARFEPGSLLEMPSRPIKHLSDAYLAMLKRSGPEKDRVIDKQPENIWQLGLIHLCLPQAKVVHCRRDPLDTAVSIYSTPNLVAPPWTHDLDDIAFVYSQYLRLTEHWRAVLPTGRLLEVDYEELVSDPKAVIRAMIDFCGLDWDDRCLRHEGNERAIRTPSVRQARQPLYGSSVGRSRRYGRWCEQLRPSPERA